MSRKSRAKSDRSPDAWSKAAKRGAGTAAAGSQPSIGWTILFAALALVVSAVFFAQFIRPDGFLAALTQADMARLERNQDSGVVPYWDTLFASLREELRRQPTTRRHEAVARLIAKLIDVERGKADAATASTEIDSLLAEDTDNLLSRVVCAVIGDEAAAATTADAAAMKSEQLIARFQAMDKVVAGERPARESRLYNKEYDEAWFAILRKGVSRLDVASNLAKYIRHYDIREHYAALPMIQRRLGALADELEVAGHRDEARSVRRWLVHLFVGLIRSEPDAGTRLLCADLLERTLGEDDETLEASLVSLRRAFHLHCARAPTDIADPSREHSALPTEYGRAFGSLVFVVIMAIWGLTGAILLALAPISAIVRRLFARRKIDAEPSVKPAERTSIGRRIGYYVMMIALPIVAASDIAWEALDQRVYSEKWLAAVIMALVSVFAFVLLAAASVRRFRTHQIHKTYFLFPGLFLAISSATIVNGPTSTMRRLAYLDQVFSGVGIIAILFGSMIFVMICLFPFSPRHIARSAASAWLLGMVMAVCALQAHAVMDRHYQDRLSSSLDAEFELRLGENWQQRYLSDVIRAYDIPSS